MWQVITVTFSHSAGCLKIFIIECRIKTLNVQQLHQQPLQEAYL